MVFSKISRRASFSEGMPVSRARVMFSAARSSGRPTRLLRSAEVVNSSISLPVWRDMPRRMAPAAAAASTPAASKASGLRKASIRPISSGEAAL